MLDKRKEAVGRLTVTMRNDVARRAATRHIAEQSWESGHRDRGTGGERREWGGTDGKETLVDGGAVGSRM